MTPTTTHALTADRISTISVSSTIKVMQDADRLRREGIDVVDLSAGEPDFPTPDNIKRAAIAAINENFTKYTPSGGTLETRQAVVGRHKLEYGTDYKPSECLITVGGKHVLFNYTQALLNPGDEVVIPVPYWVTYKDIVNYTGSKCVFVETDEKENFALTAAMVEKHLTPKTRMIIINSPNNPSGALVPQAEFEKIYAAAAKNDIFLVTDECYSHFLYDSSPYSIASMANSKNTVLVAGTVSKTYAMTGWRIGYGLAPEPIIGAMLKLQSHSTSNPTSIAQKAAIEALNGPQDSLALMLKEYRRRRDYIVSRLRAMPGVECTMPAGAFYVYPNVRDAMDKGGMALPLEFADRLLKDAAVAIVPGEAFGTNDHVRISYATSMQEIERGMDRLQKFVERLGS
jgi:aspartate aminotransferase